MVDAADSKSAAARRASSSLASGTKSQLFASVTGADLANRCACGMTPAEQSRCAARFDPGLCTEIHLPHFRLISPRRMICDLRLFPDWKRGPVETDRSMLRRRRHPALRNRGSFLKSSSGPGTFDIPSGNSRRRIWSLRIAGAAAGQQSEREWRRDFDTFSFRCRRPGSISEHALWGGKSGGWVTRPGLCGLGTARAHGAKQSQNAQGGCDPFADDAETLCFRNRGNSASDAGPARPL